MAGWTVARRWRALAGAVVAVVLAGGLTGCGQGGDGTVRAWGTGKFGRIDGMYRFVVSVRTQRGESPARVAVAAAKRLAAAPGVDSAQPLRDGGVLVTTRMRPRDVLTLPGVTEVTADDTLLVAGRALAAEPGVTGSWHLVHGERTVAPTATIQPTADVGAAAAWRHSTGAGSVIAVIDTGAAAIDPLDGTLWTNPAEACAEGAKPVDADRDGLVGDCHGWNFVTGTPDVRNRGHDASHGTMVATVLAGRLDAGPAGLAPDAKLMVLVAGSGSAISASAAAAAIYYAVDHEATVINASFAGETSNFLLAQAFAYADQHGVPIVVAAGNDSADRDAVPLQPASYDTLTEITVGASSPTDTVAPFSAYGTDLVDLFAPGEWIRTRDADGRIVYADGTSMAAPLVAATYALEHSARPDASPAYLIERLLRSTQTEPPYVGKCVTSGRLDAGAAVRTTVSGVVGR